MEGPSLYLAKKQLKPFKGHIIKSVTGNTSVDKQVFFNKKINDIFAWGKHLVFQFDNFALRVHFLLYGTFEARIDEDWVTADYRKSRIARLAFIFEDESLSGEINMYNCSIKILDNAKAKEMYDFTKDIMSTKWNSNLAYRNVQNYPEEMIADVLLDQEIFAGVGNIIKNEILSINKINPKTLIKNISSKKIKDLILCAQSFSKKFYKWRESFVLRKNLKIHRRSLCPHCATKIIREKTGKRMRWSYWCPVCQELNNYT